MDKERLMMISQIQSRDSGKNERGIALGIVILTAVVFSVAAFAVLTLTLGGTQRSSASEQRLRAQYAAEAGLVWAMQRLWANPNYCGAPDPPAIGGINVDVTVTNCGAGNTHTISAKAAY